MKNELDRVKQDFESYKKKSRIATMKLQQSLEASKQLDSTALLEKQVCL